MAVRSTQLIKEVFRSGSASDSTVRVTQLIKEVFRLDPTFGQVFNDSFTLSDNVKIEIPVAISNLTVTEEDWLSKIPFKGNPNNLKDSWKDGFELFMDAADYPLYLSIEDLDAFTDDQLVLGLGLIFNDDLDNWSDEDAIARSYLLKAYDSMFYNIFDAVTISYLLSQTFSDDADNLLDTLVTSLNTAVNQTGDQLIISDETKFLMPGFQTFSDALSLSDTVILELDSLNSFADDLDNLADAVIVTAVGPLTVNVADDADNLSDALSSLTGGSEVSYLRRYLNDII